MNSGAPSNRADVAVVVLTLNEAPNIGHALDSAFGWARELWVVDSCSTDDTVEIARGHGAEVIEHAFEDYARQRNFALDALPLQSEWILFLDADERLTAELKGEISELLAGRPGENGFYIKRRLMWMGQWIRRGYYPTWILRLFRRGTGRCEDRPVNEHIIVQGETGRLMHDFVHDDRKGIDDWIAKHSRYATREALELLRSGSRPDGAEIDGRLTGSQAERKRWVRYNVWNRLPPLVRPLFYFFYRYVLTGAFLEGRRAFAFHFLQALWYPMLIDIKYLELLWKEGEVREGARPAAIPPTDRSREA